jgi:hypothetical protein
MNRRWRSGCLFSRGELEPTGEEKSHQR